MLNYWLSVFVKTFWDSLTFIGQSRSGLLFASLILSITLLWLWKKHGWREVMKHWWRTAGEGVAITVIAFLLVCIANFVNEPFHLQEDMRARWNTALDEKHSSDSQLQLCKSDFGSQKFRADLLQGNLSSQQQTINSQQEQLNAAQGTMNSCVVSLGKMNPIANRKISALALQMASETDKDRFGFPTKKYLFAIVIMTNQTLEPVGDLKCEKPFSPSDAQLTTQARAAMIAPEAPTPISDREYEIRVSNTGASWTDGNPIFLAAFSDSVNLGKCTFAPQQ